MGTNEEQWLTYRWPYLRDAIRAIFMRHCDIAIRDIVTSGTISDASWKDLIAAALAELGRQRSARPDLCAAALDLLAEPAPLRTALEDGRKLLMADDSGAARIHLIKRGLTRIRNIRIGGTEHRGRTWALLDRISREVALAQAAEHRYDLDRCSKGHFVDLLGHLRANHAHDRNLPRTLEGIEDYFQEFCGDCRDAPLEDGIEGRAGSDILALPDAAAQGARLELCLEGLAAEEREYIAVKFELDRSAPGTSVLAFCTRHGIERTRFGRIVQGALEKLNACLTGKIEQDYPELLGFRSAWQDI
jgi:hypothetical protein